MTEGNLVDDVEALRSGDVEERGRSTLLYLAGAPWSAVAGTDKHLASELARERTVVWVDPPMSWVARRRRGLVGPRISRPMPGLVRVSTSCVPGVSRPLLRRISRVQADRDARRALRQLGIDVRGVVLSDPEARFPRWAPDATRVYFETDDFVAGAELLGRSVEYARRCRRRNLEAADVVVAVTQDLVDKLLSAEQPGYLLPNGTSAHHYADVPLTAPAPEVRLPRPIAGVIGQLNERLDLDALEAVGRTGTSLLLVGPRYEESAETRERLDALVALPHVQWIDRRPYERMPAFMAALDVGLTPYLANEFNRASHPLKTLEYLAAGLPVLSTDLPSARAFDSELVMLASTPDDFARLTLELVRLPRDDAIVARRQEFARQHSWAQRARRLADIVDLATCTGSQGGL